MGDPPGVGICHQDISRLNDLQNSFGPLNILIRDTPHFELETPIPFISVFGHIVSHFLGRILGNGPVKREFIHGPAAQQGTDRCACRLPQYIPAGDIQRRFHIIMPEQGHVHQMIDEVELAGILSQDVRPDLLNTRRNTLGIGIHVGRTQRADFGITL